MEPEELRAPPLQVAGLRKTFGGRGRRASRTVAVDDVSFELERGRTLAVVGESGSGKSTVARLCMRLYDPDDGRILVAGRRVDDLPQRRLGEFRQQIQMVFQDPMGSLNPRRRCVSSICDPLRAAGAGAAQARKRALEVADLVGLTAGQVDRFPHELSGGQRQRVGLARALSVNPQVVILDEAVSALDVSIQAQVLNLLKDVQAELGLSYLFITHDMAVVRFISDRVVVMYRGRIVEEGSTAQVLDHPRDAYTRRLLESVPSLSTDSYT